MTSPFQSVGGTKAVLRERAIVIQDADGSDVIRIGKGDDGQWTIQLVDTAGQERVRIGQLAGAYGIRARNSDGDIVYEVDNEGQSIPFLHCPMGSNGVISGMLIQNATYGVDGFNFVDFYAVAPRINLVWGASFPEGHSSTMDVRIRCEGTANTTLYERFGVNGAASETVDVLLPPGMVGTVVRLILEARRASGADALGLQVVRHPINLT